MSPFVPPRPPPPSPSPHPSSPSLFVFFSSVNLLDSKASQGELGWISYPSHGVSILSHSCITLTAVATLRVHNRGFSKLLPFTLHDVGPMSQMQINPHFFSIFFSWTFYSVWQVIGQAFRGGHMVETLKRKCSSCASRCLQED